jgi:hypothetical protein
VRRRGSTLASALLVAGALSMLAARPVLADHDHDDHHRHHHHHEYHDNDWYRSHAYYGYGGYSHYYYQPRVEYYSDPVYVPPPRSSFGLNLVFPIH